MPLKLKQDKRHEILPSGRILIEAVSYRIPRPVTSGLQYPSGDIYPLCPRCDRSLDREYMEFCNCCGQHLSWRGLAFATVIQTPRKKS